LGACPAARVTGGARLAGRKRTERWPRQAALGPGAGVAVRSGGAGRRRRVAGPWRGAGRPWEPAERRLPSRAHHGVPGTRPGALGPRAVLGAGAVLPVRRGPAVEVSGAPGGRGAALGCGKPCFLFVGPPAPPLRRRPVRPLGVTGCRGWPRLELCGLDHHWDADFGLWRAVWVWSGSRKG
jgi:hypothetical protein